MRSATVFAAAFQILVMSHAAQAGLPPRVQDAYDRLAGIGRVPDDPMAASFGYSVTVESRMVAPGDTFSLGVFFENEQPVVSIVLPLVIRAIDEGAYFRDVAGRFNRGSRLNGYLDGEYEGVNYLQPMMQLRETTDGYSWVGQGHYQPCFGKVSRGSRTYESPDMVLIVLQSFRPGTELPPGTDGEPGVGDPMISLAFAAGMTTGQFEIDTSIACPSNHLSMITGLWGTSTVVPVLPSFQKGLITVAGEPVVGVELNDSSFTPLPFGGSRSWSDDEDEDDESSGGIVENNQDDFGDTDPEPQAEDSNTTPAQNVWSDPTAELQNGWSTRDAARLRSKSIRADRASDNLKLIDDPAEAEPNDPVINSSTDVDGPDVQTNSAVRPPALYPNPFNAETMFAYDLEEPSRVQLMVYDVLGRRVATLVDHYQDAGRHFVTWSGYTSTGQSLPTGVYLYRYRVDGAPSASGKLVYLK